MNCKPGDIAQIVRAPRPSLAVYLGSIVRCERFIGPMDGLDEFTRQPTTTKAAWECTALSPRLAASVAKTQRKRLLVADAILRPLPGDLTPETIDREVPCPI